MNETIKKIISLLVLLLLLSPTIVKLEHNHKQFECHSKTEKHIHTQHETCFVCNFEFSIFFTDSYGLFASLINTYFDLNFSKYTFQYSQLRKNPFSLRAPPYLFV